MYKYVIFIIFLFPGLVQAETILFGYDSDAVPISSNEVDSKSRKILGPGGFCGELYKHLRRLNYNVNYKDIGYDGRRKRFEGNGGLPDSVYGIECSSTTITQERIKTLEKMGGYFSDSFYSSEVAVLVKRNDEKYIDDASQQNQITLAIFDKINSGASNSGELTTESAKDVFFKNTKPFSGSIRTRGQAYDCLIRENNGCNAYISDEILLRDLLYWKEDDEPTLSSKGYVIHKNSYSSEPYGIIVYDKNNAKDKGQGRNKLLTEINSWIAKEGRIAVREKIERAISSQKEKNESFYEKYVYNNFDKIPYIVLGWLLFFTIGLAYKRRKLFKRMLSNRNRKNIITVILPKDMTKDEFMAWVKAVNEENAVSEAVEEDNSEEVIRIRPIVDDFIKNTTASAGKKIGDGFGDVVVSFIKDRI